MAPGRQLLGASPPTPDEGRLVLQADYTRYEGSHLRTSLARLAVQAGANLGRRLCAYLRPKCHAILLDTTLNSRTTVRLNIYQANSKAQAPQALSATACEPAYEPL